MRKVSLNTIIKILPSLDLATLNDNILPSLEKIRKLGTDSEITMGLLKLYEEISKKVSIDVIGNKLLP